MDKISERARRLQALFGDIAKNVAPNTNVIQRERKITVLSWLSATGLGWMNNKKGPLNNIVEHFEQQGIAIREQAVSQRFDPHAVEFFKQMIAKSCRLLVDNNTEVLPKQPQ